MTKEKETKPNNRKSLANNFSIKELKIALDNYKPNNSLKGKKNGMFKSGTGEKYVRIRINGIKVRRSHIIWVLNKGKIPKGYNVHHKDENKRNDDFGNLDLIKAGIHGSKNLWRGRRNGKRI